MRALGLCVVLATAATVSAVPQETATKCSDRCKEQKNEQVLIDACLKGCDVFLVKQAAEKNIFINPFTALQRSDDRAALIKCTNDCSLDYHDNEAESCSDGCRWQRELSVSASGRSHSGTFLNFGDNGLHIVLGSMPEMPRLPQGVSNLFNQVNNMVNDQLRSQHGNLQRIFENSGSERQADARVQNTSGSDNLFGDMFNSMHQSMQEMMKGFMGAASSGQDHTQERNEDGKLVHGGGELVVIKSGPGFHEEKKYMLGPDADIEKILDSNMNDMLSHENPMDKLGVDSDQVEVFGTDPEKLTNELDKFIADSDPWGITNDLHLEGPKLPETGLKSRHLDESHRQRTNFEELFKEQQQQPRFIYVDAPNVCAQEKSKMSWGDWFNCLHVRMGLPNWLLVSTVSLGVIFTLWLCLVIPSNPPKQKVKAARVPKNVNVKELEANGHIATIIMPPPAADLEKAIIYSDYIPVSKVDLPPSYDDLMMGNGSSSVDELKKKQPLGEDQVEDGFSAKLVLEDDEEILEPLPQNSNNQANESNA